MPWCMYQYVYVAALLPILTMHNYYRFDSLLVQMKDVEYFEHVMKTQHRVTWVQNEPLHVSLRGICGQVLQKMSLHW